MKPLATTIAIVFAAGSFLLCAQNYPPQQYPPPPPYYGPQPPYYGQQQQYPQQPPSYPPQQLNALTGRIALYPDPLLAEVLTAATYSNQIPDAAGWARAHSYITGEALARAIQDDQLPWDPSVIALLPFPSVLDMMAGDMGWTQQLGNAVLADRGAVMDAVQRQRSMAMSYGYLGSNDRYRVVNTPGAIEILPVSPGIIYVPYYDPYVVYVRPRPGFYVGGAITFGPRIVVGVFTPWGWGGAAFVWHDHRILINNRPWERDWRNRQQYVHPYSAPRPHYDDRRQEHHDLHEYRGPERREDRGGGDRRGGRDDRGGGDRRGGR